MKTARLCSTERKTGTVCVCTKVCCAGKSTCQIVPKQGQRRRSVTSRKVFLEACKARGPKMVLVSIHTNQRMQPEVTLTRSCRALIFLSTNTPAVYAASVKRKACGMVGHRTHTDVATRDRCFHGENSNNQEHAAFFFHLATAQQAEVIPN